MERARRYHRDGIERHFARHEILTGALEKVNAHVRRLRPGRTRG